MIETDQTRYTKVANGIGMSLASVLVLLIWLLAFLTMPLVGNFGPGIARIVLFIMTTLAVPILVTSLLLNLAGPCLCLATPREARATGWILLAIVLAVLGLLHAAAPLVARVHPLVISLAPILTFATQASMTFFLRKLSKFLNRPDLVSLATSTLVLGALAFLAVWLSGRVPFIEFGLLVFGLLAFLRQLRLLQYVRTAVLEKARSAAT